MRVKDNPGVYSESYHGRSYNYKMIPAIKLSMQNKVVEVSTRFAETGHIRRFPPALHERLKLCKHTVVIAK